MYSVAGWDNFFFAELGASAALAGLLFVSISINLKTVIEGRGLPGRAFETLLLLFGLIVISSFALVPQPPRAFGIECVAVGAIAWLVTLRIQFPFAKDHNPDTPMWAEYFRVAIAAVSTLTGVVAGITLVIRAGGGMYWLVPMFVATIINTFTSAWVLLVEIQR